MDQELYEKAKQDADMFPAMGQGLTIQGLETFPEMFEKLPGVDTVPERFFSTYLGPFGDKIVHLGAFYGGSKFTMAGMDYLMEDAGDETLMAGALLATTAVGGGMEMWDAYFDMADMAANYAGWYLASESYLEEGPTEKIMDYIREREEPVNSSGEYQVDELYSDDLEERMEALGKVSE